MICAVTLSIVIPQAIGIFLRNRIGDHTEEFLVNSFRGFIGIQCSWIALISLFLSRVWGHVCLVVSDRSKFLSQLVCLPSFLSIFLLVHNFCLYSRVYTWFLLAYPHIYVGFLHTVTYALIFSFLGQLSVAGWVWMIVEYSCMLLESVYTSVSDQRCFLVWIFWECSCHCIFYFLFWD